MIFKIFNPKVSKKQIKTGIKPVEKEFRFTEKVKITKKYNKDFLILEPF